MGFKEELYSRRLFFDGAMGTLLQSAGLPSGELPELWNIEKLEVVEGIHRQYLDAGADIITTNTFGANALKLCGAPFSVGDTVAAAVRAAKRAANGRSDVFTALDIGPTGRLLAPLGDLSFEEAVAAFAEAVRAGDEAGADLILIETMSDLYELKAAVLAAKENSSLPVIATFTLDARGRLLTGGDISCAVALLEGLGVDALGMNCGLGPAQMLELLAQLRERCSVPIIVQPNAGLPRYEDGRTFYDVSAEGFAETMEKLAGAGVWLLGGCCGTTPEHIKATVERCRRLPLAPLEEKELCVVCSSERAEDLGRRPLIIGERINPTGKPRLREALKESDMDYILRLGLEQQEKGAHILDVNVGLPELDEVKTLRYVVEELQSVSPLPLQLDSSDATALERSMRIYNGKALINSVNGKAESMAAVFPLIRKYGGVAVALTLDEGGIPESAEGRCEIAKRIIDTAAEYGIKKKDIVVDPLTLTIGTDDKAARVTLESLRLIKEKLGVATVLGVSNVSFGLPRRELVNSAFLALALQNGLDAAIMNPASEPMRASFLAFVALSGDDEGCRDYIEAFGGTSALPAVSQNQELSLRDMIKNGLRARAASAAQQLLESGTEPLQLVSELLIPALDEVGRGFEAGTVFLPQLLMSAEAAKEAFEVVKQKLAAEGGKKKRGERIVIATVKGDIHDIGKNIVKVLLENYGFKVLDLGKDVAPEKVLEAARDSGARLVGLSALMTTTVPAMEQTVRLIKREKPDCRVMVGGAVLNSDYAERMGADFYGADAMASVKYAQKILGG